MTTVLSPPVPDLDRAVLAHLVAHPIKPRPFYIAQGNAHDGWAHDVDTAARSGRAYALTVAPDVLAWDLDTPAQVSAGHALVDELRRLDLPALLTPSGRPGHGHLWVIAPSATARADVRARARAHLLPDPRTTIRPPGAPHHTYPPPALPLAAAEFSRAVAALRDAHRDAFEWRTVLASGRFPRGWPGERSGSAMTWHICIRAIRSGVALDELRRMLADPAHRGGTTYRARLTRQGKQHGDHWLDHYVWPSAERAAGVPSPAPADAAEAREQLDALAAAIDAAPWRGQAGATDRSVLLALVRRGHARGSLTPTMSLRELAEAAPCVLSTVQRAIRRLEAAGWLYKADRGRGRTVTANGEHHESADATRWRIRIERAATVARLEHTGGTPRARTELSVFTSRARLDACRWGGLGLNAPRVLDELTARGPLDVAALAGSLELNRGNLRARLLPRLASHGLVVRGPDGRWSVVDDLTAALETAADALGLTGKADAVAAQHAAERAAYLEWREHHRPDREARKRAAVEAAVRPCPRAPQPMLWSDQLDTETGVVIDLTDPPRPIPPPPDPGERTPLLVGRAVGDAL